MDRQIERQPERQINRCVDRTMKLWKWSSFADSEMCKPRLQFLHVINFLTISELWLLRTRRTCPVRGFLSLWKLEMFVCAN